MSELTRQRQVRGTGGGSRRRPFLLGLPPWRRAVALGLRSPAAVVAVLGTTAILACAVASAPLFLSSARSAALHQQLAPQCAEAAWPTLGAGFGLPTGTGEQEIAQDGDLLRQAWAAVGHPSRPVVEVLRSRTPSGSTQGGMLVRDPSGQPLSQPAALLWRPGVTAHVSPLAASGTAGVWVPETYARAAGARVGDRITVSGVPVTVAGVYTDLFRTDPGPYWCDYHDLFINAASSDRAPPALLLATDQVTAYRVAAGAGQMGVAAQVPVDGQSLTATQAREWQGEMERALESIGVPPDAPGVIDPRLGAAVRRAGAVEGGLRGPVIPVAVAGGVLALVLVGAAGSFWADRRASEVRLLAARGVGPTALATKAALELALPALAGALLGWGLSRLLVAGLGPAGQLDPSATTTAAWAGLAAFGVGLACAAAVAGLRARGTAERPLGTEPRWPARVPWELLLLAAAGWCWALLRGHDAIVLDQGVAQVNGLLVAFPLLGVAGAAVLVTRAAVWLLPRLRRWADRRPSAVFLAVNRLAAAPLAAGTLLVAVALPASVLGYTATLTASSQATLDAKAAVQVGAAHALTSVDRIPRTAATRAVGTVVDRYQASVATPDGQRVDAQVLAIDPATFAGTAFWRDSFADRSLADLVAALSGPPRGDRVPVVAMGVPAGDPQLRVGSQPVAAQVVAAARVLPGRRLAGPLLLVSADRLPRIAPNANPDRTSELWTDGPAGPAIRAVVATGGRAPRVLEPGQVFATANFVGISWTFGYLSALAVFVGVIAVGGLLLYLEARSRSRISGYVMARRLGLSRRGHLVSLAVELTGAAVSGLLLGGVLAGAGVAVVYRRLDVDLLRPPTPLLDVPWTALGGTVLAAVGVALLAALYAQRAADRADPASVLREDA